MLSPEDIQFYVSILKGVSIADIYRLFKTAKTKSLKAGDIYIDEGTVSTKMGHIKKGLMRAYQLKPNGDEITMLLRWEGLPAGPAPQGLVVSVRLVRRADLRDAGFRNLQRISAAARRQQLAQRALQYTYRLRE